jgi:chromosome segregation ATPase
LRGVGLLGSLWGKLKPQQTMNLTKEDLEAIRGLIKEEIEPLRKEIVSIRRDVDSIRKDVDSLRKDVDALTTEVNSIKGQIKEEIEPLHKIFKQVLNAQMELVDKDELLTGHIKLIMFHLNLSPDSSELRNTLKKLE